MGFFIFLVFLCFVIAFVFVLNYYRRLFSDNRDEYKRKELIDYKDILIKEWNNLVIKDKNTAYIIMGVSVFAALLFSVMGGLYGKYYESYIFNSALIPAGLFFVIPFLKDSNVAQSQNSDILNKILDHDLVLFFGFSCATAANLISIYIIYHALSFLWILLNFILIIVLLLFFFYKKETGKAISSILPNFSGKSEE
ncbi:MAG: hypothetical protein OEZ22_11035 [Spirochaetia bacterium]|nr:hypothetical protein [Spirochaetia bacterium]